MKTRIKALELAESSSMDADELICELRDSFWYDLNSRCHRDAKNWAFYGAHYCTINNLDEGIYHFQGLVQYADHDFKGSERLLSDAIQLASETPKIAIRHIQIYEDYVIVLHRLHRNIEGYKFIPLIADFYEKINKEPSVRFLIRASIICRALERYGEVRAYLDKAERVGSKDGVYLSNRIVQLWEDYLLSSDKDPYRGKYLTQMTSILESMEKNLVEGEKDASLMNNMGVLYYLRKEYGKSIQYVNKALDIDHEDAIAHFNKGLTEFRQEKYEAAKSSFDQAQSWYLREQDPGGSRNAELFSNISEMKLAGKRDEEEDEKEFLNFLFNFLDTIDHHQNFFIERFLSESQFYETLLSGSKPSDIDNMLVILRGWHSIVPPYTSVTDSIGGGYFLKWHSAGIVIDPGFHFIRNFFNSGFSILSIDAIIITSSMLDHCNDFEALLRLFGAIKDLRRIALEEPHATDPYIKGKLPSIDKRVDLILTPEVKEKFLGQIEKTYKDIIGTVQILDPSKTHFEWYCMKGVSEKATVRLTSINNKVLPDQRGQQPAGIVLELLGNDGSSFRKVGYTSDTMWFNDILKHYEDCDILVAHLGPIRAIEFRSQGSRDEKLNHEHLGLFGCFRLIKYRRPKLFVISDMGKELARRRSKVVSEFNKKFWLGPKKEGSTKTISSELGMIIDLSDLSIKTENTEKPVPYYDVDERFDVFSGRHLYV
jgi:tetratricopeptide (TPR) repeat protein